jgi:FMN phosphatase YigB (HAD superfamily)
MADLKPRDGCYQLLECLQRRYDLIICSDTSGVTKAIAKRFDLERYFLTSFYSLDVGWMKSDVEYWAKVLAAFPGTGPDAFVMVGDNPRRDVHWPNFLGITTIQIKTTELLSRRSLEVDDEPDYYVTRLDEIADLIVPPTEPA